MSFKTNDVEQISLFDSFNNLTPRKQKALAIKNSRRDVSRFELNDERSKVIKCPAGNTPNFCCYKPSIDEFKLSFDRDTCANCPNKDKCHAGIVTKEASPVDISGEQCYNGG